MANEPSGKKPPLHETISAQITDRIQTLYGVSPEQDLPKIVLLVELLRTSDMPVAAAHELARRHQPHLEKLQRRKCHGAARTFEEALEDLAGRVEEPRDEEPSADRLSMMPSAEQTAS